MKRLQFLIYLLLTISLISQPLWSVETVGIYSGSFDPPTLAHKEIMKLSLKQDNLKTLYIFVNVSGTKDYKAAFSEREAMINSMMGVDASKIKIVPSLQENKNDIITKMSSDKNKKILLYIGQDSFEILPKNILENPDRHWVVIPRGDKPLSIPSTANVSVIKSTIPDTSSSEIRSLIASNRIKEARIDSTVAKYITEHDLYRPPTEALAKSKQLLYEKAFADYIKNLKTTYPSMNLSSIKMPPYLAEQSKEAWPDKFARTIISEMKMSGEAADSFRVKSVEVLKVSPTHCSPGVMKSFSLLK